MNRRPRHSHLPAALTPRQQNLDFGRQKRWQQLPRTDQQACRQLIARLLRQVILQTRMESDDE